MAFQRQTSAPFGYVGNPKQLLADYEAPNYQGFLANTTDFGPGKVITYLNDLLNQFLTALRNVPVSDAAQADFKAQICVQVFIVLIKSLTINVGINDKKKLKDWRDRIATLSSAAKECENVFRQANNVTAGGNVVGPDRKDWTCWLCGWTIGQMDSVLEGNNKWNGTNSYSPASPECEHIAPAGAAILYLDIPQKNQITGATREMYVNYEQSHKYCNASAKLEDDEEKDEEFGRIGKSDKLFFNMFDGNKNLIDPAPSETFIRNYLNGLSATPVMQKMFIASGVAPATWIENRLQAIGARVKLVTDFITAERATRNTGTILPGGFYEGQIDVLTRNINYLYNERLQSMTAGEWAEFRPLLFQQFGFYLTSANFSEMSSYLSAILQAGPQNPAVQKFCNNGCFVNIFAVCGGNRSLDITAPWTAGGSRKTRRRNIKKRKMKKTNKRK